MPSTCSGQRRLAPLVAARSRIWVRKVSPGAPRELRRVRRRRGAIWKLGQESELAGLPFNMAGALQLVLLAQTVAAVPPAPCYKVSETYVRCRAYLPLSTVDLNVSVS